MSNSSFMSSWVRVMSHPAAVFGGLAAGIGVGLASGRVAAALAPAGDMYITLLKMLVLPFMVSAIIVSLARLLSRGGAGAHLSRIAVAIVASMFIASAVGVATGLVLTLGQNLHSGSQAALGRMVNESTNAFAADTKVDLAGPPSAPNRIAEVTNALTHVFPSNIFEALSLGDSLKVVVFSLLFGLALGVTPRGGASTLIDVLETAFRGCQTMMRGINTLLPIAICAMVAPLVGEFGSGAGVGSVQTMLMFVVAQVVGVALVFLISAVTVSRRAKMGIVAGILALREPIIMAFGTRNSIACIPSAIDKMSEKLRISRSDLELVVPLGVALCRFGPVTYYAISTLFIAQLYDVHLHVAQLVVVLLASMAAGLASSGSNGLITIAMVALVCGPLGLPVGAAMVLFIAVDPVVAGFRVVSIVYGTCSLASVICEREEQDIPMPAQAA